MRSAMKPTFSPRGGCKTFSSIRSLIVSAACLLALGVVVAPSPVFAAPTAEGDFAPYSPTKGGDAAADATPIDAVTGVPGGNPLYAGLSMYEAACQTYQYEAAASAGCWWEALEVVGRAAQCAAELYGFGKLLKARKIMREADRIKDAVMRAERMHEALREILIGALGIIAGDCVEYMKSIWRLLDCLFPQDDDVASGLSIRRRAAVVLHPMAEGVLT